MYCATSFLLENWRGGGALNFLLRCNYDPKHVPQLPIFYRNMLEFFKELKTIYGYDQGCDLVLFDNERNSRGTNLYFSIIG